ncbi:MAG: DUF349 domain-containing protein [Crocinitomicaceae bacterium]|nr:DUF349 domain-containing protein [Crocinitomicaceae bacterium]MDC0099341.1 DUF349 domain-containing protein [Crocinitomicaceae bacterium]MDC1384983.1 DUF349 domain-containing protein [Crocinitomicaceae bacterium]
MESIEFIEELKALVANENPLAVSNQVNDLRTKFNDFMLKQNPEKVSDDANTEASEVVPTDEEIEDAAVEAVVNDNMVSEEKKTVAEVEVTRIEEQEGSQELEGESVDDQPEVTPTDEEIEENAVEALVKEEGGSTVEDSQEPASISELATTPTEEAQPETEPNTQDLTDPKSVKDAFYLIYNDYKAKKKAVIDKRNSLEITNLQEKKALITKLREVVTKEENIGSAFSAFKEIQENWKTVGDIPRANRNEIQAEYSKLLEDFFYNIKIYKELKDYDFNRNYQLKMEIIEKLKILIELKNIKDLETQLKGIQNDWEDIGPVPNEKWEEVKDAYWTEVRSSYDRINRFYDDRRILQQENLKQKEALLTEVKELAATVPTLETLKDWDSKTSAVLEIQKKWKSVGFGPKKENEVIWKAFRAACDEFFNAKKEFFGKVNEQFDGIAKQKQELIDKAIALKASTDWKETSNQLIQLQKQWKTLGHAGRKNEQKLWKAFRTACDDFFNSKNSHFSEQDKAYEDNLTAKNDILKEIDSAKLPEDKKEALAILKEFSNKFNAIGRVPMKSKDAIFKSFKDAMDKQYGALKMDSNEKDAIMFEAKIETIKASPRAADLFYGMKQDLRKEIDKEMKEINLLENNLGFFANSKGADALKKDVEKKVNRSKEKINEIKQKLKMVPNE